MKGKQILNKTHNKKVLSFLKIEKFIINSIEKQRNIIYNEKTHIVATFKDYLQMIYL